MFASSNDDEAQHPHEGYEYQGAKGEPEAPLDPGKFGVGSGAGVGWVVGVESSSSQ